MSDFIKGLELNENFYNEIVAEVLKSNFPNLKYSAALIGWGSEVLGYDDALSADHNWGLRFQIFLSIEDFGNHYLQINDVLNEKLPNEYKKYPTSFELNAGKDQLDKNKSKDSKHNIEIETVESFFIRYLGCYPFHQISYVDWLTFSEHKLLAITSGKVFHDGLGTLTEARQNFAYYPRDIWIYLLSVQWETIFEEQAFIGRCGHIGDELGSRLLATKQVKNLMQMCFLIEKKYAPYSKWFGTTFSELECGEELTPIFYSVLDAKNLKEREKSLVESYKQIINHYNALKITDEMSDEISDYFGRPFQVIKDESVIEKLRDAINDKEVLKIGSNLGSINQFVESSDKLNDVELVKKIKGLYE